MPRPLLSRRGWLAAIVLVAALLTIVLLVRRPSPTPDTAGTTPAEPAFPAAAAERVQIQRMAPETGEVVDPRALTLVWHPAEGADRYRVVLTDEQGESLWSGETADTTLAVPADAGLPRAADVYWRVDADLPGGRTASTGGLYFRTGP